MNWAVVFTNWELPLRQLHDDLHRPARRLELVYTGSGFYRLARGGYWGSLGVEPIP